MTQSSSSLDERLVQAMRSFDPSEAQTKRMRHGVLASHDTLHRPLTLEWIAVFRSRPVLNTTLVMAAAILLLITSPLGSAGWFAWKTLVATAQADAGDARTGLLSEELDQPDPQDRTPQLPIGGVLDGGNQGIEFVVVLLDEHRVTHAEQP